MPQDIIERLRRELVEASLKEITARANYLLALQELKPSTIAPGDSPLLQLTRKGATIAQKVRVINGAAIIRGRGTRVWVRCEVSSDCGWESDDARPRTMNPQEFEHDPEVRPIFGQHQHHRKDAH